MLSDTFLLPPSFAPSLDPSLDSRDPRRLSILYDAERCEVCPLPRVAS